MEPRITLRDVTPKAARRVADIADALTDGGVDVVSIEPLADWDIDPERCECCGRPLEGGHCYACKPILGYGEGFRCERCK